MVTTMVQQNNQQNNGNQGKTVPGAGGGDNQGNQQNQQNNGNQGNTQGTPPPPHHDTFNANGTQSGANNTANTGTSTGTNTGAGAAGTGDNTGTGTGTGTSTTTTTTTTTTTQTQQQQPVILPTQVMVTGDGTTDARTGTGADSVFTITRVNNLDQTTIVNYTTADGTAHAGTDYMATSGSVTFAPGDTTATVSVPLLLGPRTVTGTDTFTLAISGTTGIAAGSAATGSVAPPPPLPTVTIGNATTSDSAPGTVTLTVTLTGNTTLPSSVHYQTGDGTAVSGLEYTPTSGTINFAPGQTSATITVPVLAESQILSVHTQHGTENFTVQLTQPTDAVLGAAATGTVTVNATPVVGQATFSVTGDSVSEGGTANVTITRGGDLVGQVSVAYGTNDDTAHAGTDYTAASGTLTFAPGQTSQTITIGTAHEAAPEPARDFTVVLANPDGGTISTGTATVNIAAVAAPPPPPPPPPANPIVSVSGPGTVNDTTQTSATFTVSLDSASDSQVSVHYTTSTGTAGGSISFPDPSDTLTFAPGQTSKTISVVINNPENAHGLENFTVMLDTPVGVSIGNGTGTGTVALDNQVITHQAPEFLANAIVQLTNPAGTLSRPCSIRSFWSQPTTRPCRALWLPLTRPTPWPRATGNIPPTAPTGPTSAAAWTSWRCRAPRLRAAVGEFNPGSVCPGQRFQWRRVPPSTRDRFHLRPNHSRRDDQRGRRGRGDAVFGQRRLRHGGRIWHDDLARRRKRRTGPTSANWTNGIPESGGLAIINNSSVILSSEGTQTISGLTLTGSTLTIGSFAALNVFDGTADANSTINVNNGTLETDDVFNVAGTLNVGIAASGGTLSSGESGAVAIVVAGTGTINAGSNSAINVDVVVASGGQLNIVDTAGVTQEDNLTIRHGGMLFVNDTTTNSQGAVFTVEGTIANAGTPFF